MTVNTKRVSRRELRFKCLDCLRGELDRIERAHVAGTLGHVGNWTPGQALGHVAAWIDYGYDGYPAEMKAPPAPVRWVLGAMKNRFLTRGLSPGVRIPGVKAGTYGVDEMPVEEGLRRLRSAADRLERGAPQRINPAFGALTHEEWTALHLRHAELHLGFLTTS